MYGYTCLSTNENFMKFVAILTGRYAKLCLQTYQPIQKKVIFKPSKETMSEEKLSRAAYYASFIEFNETRRYITFTITCNRLFIDTRK